MSRSRRVSVPPSKEYVRALISERTLRSSVERLRYILPLLSFERSSKPFVAACAVKIVAGGRRFLFTAAHCVDLLDEGDLWFASESDWLQITGRSVRTQPTEGGTRKDDRTDAAVIELHEPTGPRVPSSFLSMKGLSVNEVQVPSSKYLILGYPASKTKKDFAERTVTPRPLRYLGRGVPPARYDEAGVPMFSHVALEFDKENTVGPEGVQTAADPDGMSGCGVWAFNSLLHPGSIERDRLVAIFTEHLPRQGKVLVATRVGVHVELLRRNWPEVAAGLPEVRRIQFRIRDRDAEEQATEDSAG